MGQIGKEREEGVVQVRTIRVLRLYCHSESDCRDAREAHEVLDALQIGLPNRSSLEYLSRGSGWYSRFGVLTGTRFE